MSFDFARARDTMIESDVRTNDVTDRRLIRAMREVAREDFVPAERRLMAYGGLCTPLGTDRFLLDPRTFAKLAQFAEIGPADRILDVAGGSGYSAAVFSRLAGEVVALESAETLAERAKSLLADRPNVRLVRGDLTKGAPDRAPFDVIFINGGVEEIPPALTDQLGDGGRLLAVRLKGAAGRGLKVTKVGKALSERPLFDATVPLLPGFATAPTFVF